jgi:hypothetical protein
MDQTGNRGACRGHNEKERERECKGVEVVKGDYEGGNLTCGRETDDRWPIVCAAERRGTHVCTQ